MSAGERRKHGALGWAWEHVDSGCLEFKPTFSLKKAPLHRPDELTPESNSW